jgi:hypothetical protein
MIEDLERELTRAMTKEVADLAAPHLDLHRMQHHRPARRLVVPAAAVGVAVAVAAPLAAARGVFRSAPVANEQVQVSVSPGPVVPTVPLPRTGAPTVPSVPGLSGTVPLPSVAPTASVPDSCMLVRRTLSSAERVAAAGKLRATFDGLARRLLGAGVSRTIPTLSDADLDRLLPPAGAMITYYDCALGRVLTPEQRAAAIAEVRRAVTETETALLAARSAVEHALGRGNVPSWLGDLDIHLVGRTATTMVVRIDLATPRPGWPASGSITVTTRLADHTVVMIQPTELKLPPGLPVPQLPVPLPSLPIPVPLPSQVPGLPTGGR